MAEKKKTVRKKKVEEQSKVNESNKEKDSGIYWIIGVALFLILVLVLTPTISKKMRTVEYEGLSFIKTTYSGIPVYYYYYYYTGKDGSPNKYNLYIRINPRKNNVTINGEIDFLEKSKQVYITTNSSGFEKCPNTLRETATLAQFISGNEYSVKGAYVDEELAKQNNMTFVNCTNKPGNMVINIFWGNKTEITREGNCYKMSVGSCDGFLLAVEKFEVQSLVEAKRNVAS